jgi:ERCC4-type nuclease
LALSEGIKPIRFVGQQSKLGDKGIDQKRQIEILQEFREGLYNVLVATSVAEEGLDIAECDLVVFYDVVPSEIRYVQRKGRTGRKRPGEVIILMAQGTRDEGYYWAARRKQGEMHRILGELQEISRKKFRNLDENQMQLDKFVPREKIMDYEIVVDHRETSSTLVKELVSSGFKVNLEQLAIADYVIGNRIYIERKTCQDFSKSIIDGRLFNEVSELKQNAPHSLLVIEGEDLYTASTLRPEAIRAAFISIMIDFNMPIIWSKSGKETAAFFTTIARRELEKAQGKKTVRTRIEKSPDKTSEVQEYIVAGLPGIDTIRAKNLLAKFQTVEKIFTAVEEELMETEGIGKKLAERIRKILTEPYKV